MRLPDINSFKTYDNLEKIKTMKWTLYSFSTLLIAIAVIAVFGYLA